MKKRTNLLIVLISGAIIYSCNSQKKAAPASDILFTNLDTTVSPATDFFMYANGGWIKNNPIPGDQSGWGIANLVIEENNMRLKTIAENAAKANAKEGTPEQQIGDFWTMAMDSVKIEADGLKPLTPLLEEVDAINDIPSLIAAIAGFKKTGLSALFSANVGIDDKNSEAMIFQFNQGGIGLPNREYYFKNDSATITIREAYLKYITRMLTMSGTDSAVASSASKKIMALETKLAAASRKLEDLRDPYKNYNKIAITKLDELGKNIHWKMFLETIGITHIDSVLIGQPEFFKALDNLLITVPLADWKYYIKSKVLNTFANALPDNFGEEAFNFSKLFSGAKQRRVRWKRSIGILEGKMGEMMGRLYVNEFFNETAKKRYETLTEEIRAALKERIAKLSWMSDSTKQKAYIKLAAMKKKVGYPDKWKDFSAMKIGRVSYLQNIINANIWQHNYEINKLGKPVDHDEWDMYPQTYNAGYYPTKNEIVFPAGIFTVPGYRDEELDDALVYGYAGASTIGHEITHGFDDQGRQYDSKGNLENWWTKKDEAEFTKRASVIIKQFNEYEPVKGYHINGSNTQGENIGDLGGVLLGIEAFKKTKTYKEGKLINGSTPMQRYFLGYALGWLGYQRDEATRNRILTDEHSPAKYRVNGPFVNVEEFYTAFNVKPGDAMFRTDSTRVHIW